MSRIELPDESQVRWLIYLSDPNDPIAVALEPLKAQGYVLTDLVLPDELPRACQVDLPDWSAVAREWADGGDTPVFRAKLAANYVRSVHNP